VWERVLLVPRRWFLVKPGWITDVIGLALLALVLASQLLVKAKATNASRLKSRFKLFPRT